MSLACPLATATANTFKWTAGRYAGRPVGVSSQVQVCPGRGTHLLLDPPA